MSLSILSPNDLASKNKSHSTTSPILLNYSSPKVSLAFYRFLQTSLISYPLLNNSFIMKYPVLPVPPIKIANGLVAESIYFFFFFGI
jgi:hypothetical protein